MTKSRQICILSKKRYFNGSIWVNGYAYSVECEKKFILKFLKS